VLWIAIIGAVLVLGGGALTAFVWPGFLLSKQGPSKGLPNQRGVGGELAADLELIPGDALGFVTIRVADIVKSDVGKQILDGLKNAQGNPLALMEQQFGVSLGDIERVSIVVPSMEFTTVWAVVLFSKPVDQTKISAGMGAQAQKHQDKQYYASRTTALYFSDDKTLIVGAPTGVRHFLQASSRGKATGPLTNLVKQAVASRNHIFGAEAPAAVMQGFKNQLKQAPGGEMFAPLLELQTATMTIDFGASETKIDVTASFPNEGTAKKAQETLQSVLPLAKIALSAQKKQVAGTPFAPAFSVVEQALNDLKIQQQGPDLKIAINLKVDLAKIILDAMKSGAGGGKFNRGGGNMAVGPTQARSLNNLQQLALAFHSYADREVTHTFPAAEWRSGLSWRVALLRYLGPEEAALYSQFKLDEPWNGPNNTKLLAKMPQVFRHPTAPADPTGGMTYYKVFTGPNTPFNGKVGPRLPAAFQDGTSNTFLIVESGTPVPWTKPEDIPYDPSKPLPTLGLTPGRFFAVMADGRAVIVDSRVLTEKTFRALITPAGNEVLGEDWGKAEIHR
jgi:hypothetical protein